jgi:DNA-binding CsgD family transcriptional regulator
MHTYLVCGTCCFELTDEVKILGRDFSVDYIVLHRSVSRRHAELTWQNNQLLVTDLNSRSGTFFQTERVTQCQIPVGGSVRFGALEFSILDENSSCLNSMVSDSVALSTGRPEWRFTPAQQRVVMCFLSGLSEKETATALAISQHTVHNHVRKIYTQVDVHSRAELMSKLLSNQLPP